MTKKKQTKRPNPHTLPPDFRSKGEDAMLRQNRLVILLNDMEQERLKRAIASTKGSNKAAFCRKAIMEKVFQILEDNQPTLF